MALFEVGGDRCHKRSSVSSSLKRVLIKDIRSKGLLTDAYVQGFVEKIYPVQPSKKAGKLCKIVLKEEGEGGTKPSQCATINAFLYGDLAAEVYRILEDDVLVLSEVIVEPSPTDGHQFQLIANRQISQVSLKVISSLDGKRRIRECKEKKQLVASSSENCKGVINREADLRGCNLDCGTDGTSNDTSDEDVGIAITLPKPLLLRTKHNCTEKRKFRLGPKGVTPSVSHVKGLTNLVVLIDKVSVRNLDESFNRKKSTKCFTSDDKKRPSEGNGAVYSTSAPRQLYAESEQSVALKSGEQSPLHKQTTGVQKSTYEQKQSMVLRSRQASPRGHKRQAQNTGRENSSSLPSSPGNFVAQQSSGEITNSEMRNVETRGYQSHRSPVMESSVERMSPDEETGSPGTRQSSNGSLDGGHTPQRAAAPMEDDELTNIVSRRTRRRTNHRSLWSSATQDSSDSSQFTDFETLGESPQQKRHMHPSPHRFYASSPPKWFHVSPRCNRSVDGVTNLEESVCTKTSLPCKMPESSLSVRETGEVVTPKKMSSSTIGLGDSLETPSGNFSLVTRKRSFSSQEEGIQETSDEDEASQPGSILLPVNYTKLDHVSSSHVSLSPSKEQRCSPAKRSCTEGQITEERRRFNCVDSVAEAQDKQKPAAPLLCAGSLIPHDHITVAVPSSSTNNDNDTGVKQRDGDDSAGARVVRLSAASTHPPGPSHQQHSPNSNGSPRDRSSRIYRTPSREAVDYTVPSGYTKLANLQRDTVVNVYGVIKLFKPAWKCRGTDMCSVVFLTDPTVSKSSAEGLECVLFQENTLRLPQVHNVGDIARLHRVKIASYQDRLQAKSSRGFAAIVFDRNTELPVTEQMARVSSATFTLTQTDKDTVQKLKNWCDANPDLFPSLRYSTVASIIPDSNFHLVCQVRAMAVHQTMDCVVLFVNDGTQPQYEVRKCSSSDDYHMIVPLSSAPPGDESTVCVFLYGLHAQAAKVQVRKRGMFLILHDVHPQVVRGGIGGGELDTTETLLELCVHRTSMFGRGITMLSPDSEKAAPIVERLSGTPR